MTKRDADFYGWAIEQAELLRSGRLAEADIENLIDEIESMGKSERRLSCRAVSSSQPRMSAKTSTLPLK